MIISLTPSPIVPPKPQVAENRFKRVSGAITLGELSDRYVAFAEKHKAAKTAAADARSFRTLMEIVGDIRVDALREDVVRDALIEIAIDAPRTATVVQETLRHAWKVGQGKDKRMLLKSTDLWIPASIPSPVPDMSFQGSAVRYAMTEEELHSFVMEMVLTDIPMTAQHLLRFQLGVAGRISEICSLKNDWIRDDWIELPPAATKNRTGHRFYLAPGTRRIVEECRDQGKYLFEKPAGGAYSTSRIQHLLADARQQLYILREDHRDEISTHTLRRTALSWMKEQGIPLEVRHRAANHKPAGVQARYDWGSEHWSGVQKALEHWDNYLRDGGRGRSK